MGRSATAHGADRFPPMPPWSPSAPAFPPLTSPDFAPPFALTHTTHFPPDTGAAAPAPSRVVFVGNLPADVSDEDVRTAFSAYTVTAVDLKKLSRPP